MVDDTASILTEQEMTAIRCLAVTLCAQDRNGFHSVDEMDKAIFKAVGLYISMANRFWCRPGETLTLRHPGIANTITLRRSDDGNYTILDGSAVRTG